MLNLSYFKRENGDGYIPGDFCLISFTNQIVIKVN